MTSRVLAALRSLGFAILSLAIILGLWLAFVKGLHLNSYFAKTPAQVWAWLTSGPSSAAHRSQIAHALGTTLKDAALGYVVGTLGAILACSVFVISRTVERTLLPVAIALRSIPLVAMTPLLVLVFGRGLLGVAVITGIVAFFPTLVNVGQALRAIPEESMALMTAYDASSLARLRKLQLPSALPALFASARIAVPGAILGAMLAEWLATGKGLGALIADSVATSAFDTVWAGVVTVTLAAFVLYALVSALEALVLSRLAPQA
jgi:sulfonate transport system permease protein